MRSAPPPASAAPRRSLPLVQDPRVRVVQLSKVTKGWLTQQGIALPRKTGTAAGDKRALAETLRAHGWLVRENALMSIPGTALLPNGPDGRSPRDRIAEILKTRQLVVGSDYVSKVAQPFGLHIVPPFTMLDEHVIKGGDVRKLSPGERATLEGQIWFGRVSLLTETAKMGCYSWNLPAGPRDLGGTCPSAALGFMYGTVAQAETQQEKAYRLSEAPIHVDTFICNGCYALKGNYRNLNQTAMMMVRFAFVQTLLTGKGSAGVYHVDGESYHRARAAGAKPMDAVKAAAKAGEARRMGETAGPRALADLFTKAIQTAAVFSTAQRAARTPFGFASDDYQTVRRFYEQKLAEATKAKAKIPTASAREHTEATYAWAVPEPGYFRIHDAGDFFSLGYWEAWAETIDALPHVRFWAPNRTWAHTSRTVGHDDIPENLAMRPSALHFGDPPPSLTILRRVRMPIWQKGKGGGVAAGSGSGNPAVMHEVAGTPFTAFNDAPDEPFWKCPAYRYWTDRGGGSLFGTSDAPAGGTCILARGPNNEKGCRACWGGKHGEYSHVGVVYEEH